GGGKGLRGGRAGGVDAGGEEDVELVVAVEEEVVEAVAVEVCHDEVRGRGGERGGGERIAGEGPTRRLARRHVDAAAGDDGQRLIGVAVDLRGRDREGRDAVGESREDE